MIYEIANEPNGVSWSTIKSYAEQVIPVIRANDPDAVVIVGTRGWSSLGVSDGGNADRDRQQPGERAATSCTRSTSTPPRTSDNYRTELARAADRLPLFVTEFGTVDLHR